MPTQAETTVLRLLSAIEVEPTTTAKTIESLGNDGVTVLCDTALGSFPGLLPKVRTNAVSILGWLDHPQARETVRLLIRDSSQDIGIRALRAAGRQKNDAVVKDLSNMLALPGLTPLLAAEVVKALISIDSPAARASLESYAQADPQKYPHRANAMVNGYLKKSTE